MTDIDDRLRKSLSTEDQAFLAELDANDSLYGDLAATFRGRRRWLTALGWIAGFALFAAALFCGWRFASNPELRSMQLWGAATALCFAGLALIKVWFWLAMQTQVFVRELKRVELQLASLAAAVRGKQTATRGD